MIPTRLLGLGFLVLALSLSACARKRPEFREPNPKERSQMMERLDQRIASRDLNRDGVLTCADVDIARGELFLKVDQDQDKVLSPSEYDELKWYDKLYVLLEAKNDDLNGDGVVDLSELQARRDPYFVRIDTNEDCMITPEEMQVDFRGFSPGPGKPEGPGGRKRRAES